MHHAKAAATAGKQRLRHRAAGGVVVDADEGRARRMRAAPADE
jgi:hypothetical protein